MDPNKGNPTLFISTNWEGNGSTWDLLGAFNVRTLGISI